MEYIKEFSDWFFQLFYKKINITITAIDTVKGYKTIFDRFEPTSRFVGNCETVYRNRPKSVSKYNPLTRSYYTVLEYQYCPEYEFVMKNQLCNEPIYKSVDTYHGIIYSDSKKFHVHINKDTLLEADFYMRFNFLIDKIVTIHRYFSMIDIIKKDKTSYNITGMPINKKEVCAMTGICTSAFLITSYMIMKCLFR